MSITRVMPYCAVLVASTVRAGALITLSPTNPGPYFGGETFFVDVNITTDRDLSFRLLGFDFSQTDPAIQLFGPTGLDSTMDFMFDFTSLQMMALYATFPNLPTPVSVYTSMVPVRGFIFTMMADVPYHAGNLMVSLPTQVGTYTLDAVNYSAKDANQGAAIYFDFETTQIWSTVSDGNVEITGGTFDIFVVAPEPATLLLLTIGGLAVPFIRFRKRVTT